MRRNAFTKKKVGSMTLGERLQKIRSERRISLREVSINTKIQVKYLERLEAGDYDNLPPDVYVRGFVRSYADFLGLDEGKLLSAYAKERSIKNNLNKDKKLSKYTSPYEPLKKINFIITPRILAVAALLLFFIGAGFYLYHELGKFSGAPRLIVKSPDDRATLNENTVNVSGITDRDARLVINDQEVILNDNGEFNEQVSLIQGVNQITIHSTNRFDRTSEKVLQVSGDFESQADSQVAGAQTEDEEKRVFDNLTLEVTIKDVPTWIQIEADGNVVFNDTLQPDESKTFEATGKIILTSGKGDSTLLKLNGEDKGFAGEDTSVVRDLTFEKESQD